MEKNYKVYMHTSPSGKRYIGITCQKPNDRWGYGKNYKHNKYFSSAIEKYGWEAFSHEILYDNLSEEEAKQHERELIEQYKSNQKEYGYNISLGGDFSTRGLHFNLGRKMSEETKKKLSEANKGRRVGEKNPMYGKSGSLNPNYGRKATDEQRKAISIPIYQFDKKGNPINEFFGIREAEKQTGIDSGTIVKCAKRQDNYKTAKGFIWSYSKEIDISEYIDKKCKKLGCFNDNNELIKIFPKMVDFADFYNITKNKAYYIIKNNKKFDGFYWRYTDE